VDAHVFEYLLQQADALNEPLLLQKAINLYKGPFLGGDHPEPWAMSYQEKLRSKFLRAVVKLGQLYEERGEHEQAIECYRKGLEVASCSATMLPGGKQKPFPVMTGFARGSSRASE